MATGHVRDGCIFPVGYIVQLTVDTDPAEFFGGKWQRIKGRFLLAADDETYPPGSTGGEATHTLTVEEMPSHDHTTGGHFTFYGSGSSRATLLSWETGTARVQPKGGGQAHNNMPPYIAVYVWKRIG